jgi:hypothetical protein
MVHTWAIKEVVMEVAVIWCLTRLREERDD